MTYTPLPPGGTFHRALAAAMGFAEDGRVAMTAFSPSPRDNGELSGYDGSGISAEGACVHFENIKKGKPPIGTATVLVDDVRDIEPLDAFLSPTANNPNHSHIDFNFADKDQWRELARQLAQRSVVTYLTQGHSPNHESS